MQLLNRLYSAKILFQVNCLTLDPINASFFYNLIVTTMEEGGFKYKVLSDPLNASF